MDDFHNINAVKRATERTMTNALHMATTLLNIQPSVNGGERQGAGVRENRGEMQNANFCHSLRLQILSKTRPENVT